MTRRDPLVKLFSLYILLILTALIVSKFNNCSALQRMSTGRISSKGTSPISVSANGRELVNKAL
jgi:hypothetical protein